MNKYEGKGGKCAFVSPPVALQHAAQLPVTEASTSQVIHNSMSQQLLLYQREWGG